MRKNLLKDSQSVVGRQFSVLYSVLQQECAQVDLSLLLSECGLDESCWQDDTRVSLVDYFRVLSYLHDGLVPNIALRVADRTRFDDLGVIGYAMLSSPTLAQGLQLAGHLAEQSNPYLRVHIASNDQHALITCEVVAEGDNYRQLLTEIWIITLWRYVQSQLPTGVAACASFAQLEFPAPSYNWQFQQLLGCSVAFDQSQTVLAIPKQWLYITAYHQRIDAQSLFSDQVRKFMKGREHSIDLVSRVKRLLLERPTECGYSLERTAALMSLSARTLRRHLAASNTSFRLVVLEVRMELARDYLLNTQLTAQEIAFQLAYSQPNNFYRAFKRYYGQPPERYRLALTYAESLY